MSDQEPTSTADNSFKTYTGSCHCGFLRYSVALPVPSSVSPLKTFKCNCTLCHKLGILALAVKPATNFTLLAPSDPNDPNLGVYRNGKKVYKWYFCKVCGVFAYYEGSYRRDNQEIKALNVNATTLDQGQGLDLREAKSEYWDGLRGNWKEGTRMEPWEGGCW